MPECWRNSLVTSATDGTSSQLCNFPNRRSAEEKSRFLQRTRFSPLSTGITARHWRALLFLGFAFSVLMVRRHAATAPRKRGVRILR